MDMSNLVLQDSLREFAVAIRLHAVVPVAEFEAGLLHLEAEIERVALDAYAAQRRGLPFAEAVADFVNYPNLARMHAAFDNILTTSLPLPIVSWIRSLLAMPEPPSFDEMRTTLVAAAADDLYPHRQALARFALFEGVRLNLVLMVRWFPHATLGVGLEMGDLDRIAEARVEEWLARAPACPEEVRPFQVLVAAAVHSLSSHAEAFRTAIATLQRDFVEAARLRADVEEVLAEMDVRDALVIRNELAPDLGEQRLTVEHLKERHMLVLGDVSRNALDQRLKRACGRTRKAMKRRTVALLDILRESAAGAGGVR